MRKNKTKQSFSNNVTRAYNAKNGFALLYAVLVSSLLVSISMAIAGIAVRELELSSASRNSQFAFYAADTGAECAIYWDIRQNEFINFDDGVAPRPITCGNQTIEPSNYQAIIVGRDNGGNNIYKYVTTFLINNLNTADDTCAETSITKQRISASSVATVIESRGRNNCNSEDNRNRVERGIVVTY